VRFKFDENLPSELGALLRADGHDAPQVLDGQHVAVFGIVAAVNDPVFVVCHHRFGKLAAQLAMEAVGQSLFPAQFADLSSAGFSEDLVAPNRKVKARLLRQEQQQIRYP